MVRPLAMERGMGERSSDASAFARIYDETLPAVYRFTLSRVHDRDTADDLVADIFERALRAWPTFTRSSSPRTWILGIARHVIADHWRRDATRTLALPDPLRDSLVDGAPLPEDIAQWRDDEIRLDAAIRRLPEAEQELLALRFGAGLRPTEIAALLGVGPTAARVRLHRTLRRLEALLRATEG